MKPEKTLFIIFALLGILCGTAHASEPYSYRVEWAFFEKEAKVALWLEPGEDYHTYSHNPGEGAMPTVAGVFDADGKPVSATAGYLAGILEEDVFEPEKMVRVYNGPTPIFFSFPQTLPDSLNNLSAHISLLACSSKHCRPVKAVVPLNTQAVPNLAAARALSGEPAWKADFLRSKPGRALIQPVNVSLSGKGGAASFAPLAVALPEAPEGTPALEAGLETGVMSSSPPEWEFTPRPFLPALEVAGLGKAVLFGLLAGLILNVMPCVLPVLTLKLSALSSTQAGESDEERRRHFRFHNLWFAAGIMVWFLGLALLFGMAGLVWGQLFQNVMVVSLIMLLVFAMGLSMFGLFHLPVLDLRPGLSNSPRSRAFSSGILATLLATPCSGPLLGGVLGWSLGQSLPVLITVFAATGLGMALPYLLLALRPGAVRFLPKPGNWMLILERFMGFFLMGTSLYLLSLLPARLHMPMLSVLLVTAITAWIWGQWGSLRGTKLRRAVLGSGCLLVVAFCLWLGMRPADLAGIAWEPYSASALEKVLGKKPVLLEFTADWCPTCKVLERTSLAPSTLAPLAKQYGLVLMRVDMTRENQANNTILRALGSASIPLAALFPVQNSNSPILLRDLFTSGQLKDAMALAFEPL